MPLGNKACVAGAPLLRLPDWPLVSAMKAARAAGYSRGIWPGPGTAHRANADRDATRGHTACPTLRKSTQNKSPFCRVTLRDAKVETVGGHHQVVRRMKGHGRDSGTMGDASRCNRTLRQLYHDCLWMAMCCIDAVQACVHFTPPKETRPRETADRMSERTYINAARWLRKWPHCLASERLVSHCFPIWSHMPQENVTGSMRRGCVREECSKCFACFVARGSGTRRHHVCLQDLDTGPGEVPLRPGG